MSGFDFVIPADFNGNNHGQGNTDTDLFFLRKDNGSNKFLLKGSNTINDWNTAQWSFGASDVSNFDFVIPADFNRNGKTDLFFLNQNNGSNKFILKNSNNIEDWNTDDYSFGTNDVSDFDFVIVGYFDEIINNVSNTISKNDIQVYPNPISSGHTLNIELKGETQSQDWTVTLSNINGNEISSQNILSGNHFNSFQIGDLSKGMYFLEFSNANFFLSKKVIIQ